MQTARHFGMIRNERGWSHMVSEAQKRASAKYDAENTRQIRLKLVLKTDADILEKLDSVGNKQGYIKALIRKDIEASQK